MIQLQAYQFIKYNKNTSIFHIEKAFDTGAVICFDFEDGIINPFNINSSTFLKEEAREQFDRLYSLIYNNNKNLKIGIRLNHNQSSDFEKDLIKIKGKKFDTIFIPKIEQPKDLQLIFNKLDEYKIEYKNIIPIVESQKGLENLEFIIQSNQKLRKIAFGHCDYNLDIGIYPFFHQDSWEYWKWISVFITKCSKYGIQIINSPYLNTDNEEFFCSMLDYITSHKNQFHGQVTLSNRQSELCTSRKTLDGNFKSYLDNRNIVSTDKKFAEDLVFEFETNNKLKGLTKSRKRLISLQEYVASKKIIDDSRITNEMFIIGGCFPVQYNIVFENLFQQKLKWKIENSFENKLNINIIRYERFSNLLVKIEALAIRKKPYLIVFHVRPEPYLRLIKLFYKYIDDKGRLKWSLNLPYFNLLKSEKYDMLVSRRSVHMSAKQSKSLLHKFLISCNYLLGILIGNKRFALKSYLLITNKIIDFCKKNGIKYIILGPNRRNYNRSEPSLCKDLDLYFSSRINKHYYICGYMHDSITKMNQENGIHVTQAYHDLIAEKLFKAIVDEKFSSSNMQHILTYANINLEKVL